MSSRKVKEYKFLTPKKDRHYAVTDSESHIVEQRLNKREDLIDKYQTEIGQLVSQLNTKQKSQTIQPRALLNKRDRIKSSARAQPSNYSLAIENPLTDYKKIILGLEYTLENEKTGNSQLERKNRSLESEVSNLRNLLVRASDKDSDNSSEVGPMQAYKDRVNQLEQQIHDMKLKSAQIYEIKTESINALQKENRALRSEFDSENDKGLMKKVNQLVNLNEELRNAIYRKNLKIQQLKFGKDNDPQDKSVSSEEDEKDQATKSEDVNLLLKKIDMMAKQFDVANQLILRKNTELLQMAKSKRTNEDVITIIDDLLDKKEIGNSQLLSHPVVNKVRIFLREKVLFEKELFEKLTFHNKKIQILEEQLRSKDSKLEGHSISLEQQCRQLSRTVANLQKQLLNSERDLAQRKNEVQIIRNDYAIEKKNFVLKMRQMSQELNGIINTTQQEFEKQKLQNLKLAEQNRSLLFLVGTKQKELSDKGQAIRTFEKYKQTINNLPLSSVNVESASPSRVQTKLRSEISMADLNDDVSKPTKLLLITTFSNWLLQWNKLRNWKNRKSLLNIVNFDLKQLLDKQDLRDDAYDNCLNNLISVIHECFFNSKNLQIQERAAVLVSTFLEKGILKNKNLYINRIAPYIIKCFRAKNQGEDEEQHRIFNEAALSFTDQLDKETLEWNYQMTNEMIAVNGFKYVFSVITNDKNDELIQKAYNTLAVISRKNEMINFMVSYNVTDILLRNLDANYRFISHVLYLLDVLLDSDQYMRASSKYLLEFRSIFQILLDDDPEILQEALKCLLKLCKQSGFVRGINKKEAFPKILALLEKAGNFDVLKQAGKLFLLLVNEVDVADHQKLAKKELMGLLDIVHNNEPMSPRFSRAARLLLKCLRVVNVLDLDVAAFAELTSFMDDNFDRIDEKTRKKMIETVNVINERNRSFLDKNVTEDVLGKFVKGYLSMKPTYTVELIFFLNMMKNMHQLKKTVDILKFGRESLINKLLDDSQQVDYGVSIGALKNLLSISKEKYSEKFITPQNCLKILKYACKDKTEEEYISLCLSIMYFLSKVETNSDTLIENNLVQKMCDLLVQRHANESVVFKILAVLELNNTSQYKKRILNYIITGDKKLLFLKTLNYSLRKSKNKVQLGSRALFIYDFLNGQQQLDALATLVESNDWMVEDLVKVRNDYVGVLQPIVFKVELMLHEMSKLSKKISKLYKQFVVENDDQLDD